VQPVPAPHLVGRGALDRRTPGALRRAVAALLAALAVVAACALAVSTAGDAPAPQPAAPSHAYNGLIGGVPLQQARCAQWNAGTAVERGKVVGALAYSVGGSTPYGPGSTLSSAQAHGLFERACASPIAQHWLLYELYIRAAGFRSYVQR
jgi:hypothetical protein